MSKKISVKVVKNSKQQTERNTLLADTFENRWFQNEWKHKFKTLTSGKENNKIKIKSSFMMAFSV
ncbi:hypothetical protein ICE98_02630 [Lactococcus lactis]|nr:hypothetical protein [Lactococcus lactis]